MSQPAGRALVRAAWTLAVALAAVLVLKIFVCDVKHVESASMEPTIFGSPANGESVLVLYGPFEPEHLALAGDLFAGRAEDRVDLAVGGFAARGCGPAGGEHLRQRAVLNGAVAGLDRDLDLEHGAHGSSSVRAGDSTAPRHGSPSRSML